MFSVYEVVLIVGCVCIYSERVRVQMYEVRLRQVEESNPIENIATYAQRQLSSLVSVRSTNVFNIYYNTNLDTEETLFGPIFATTKERASIYPSHICIVIL